MRMNKSVRVLVIVLVAAGLLVPLIAQWLPARRPVTVVGRFLAKALRDALGRGEKALWQQDFETARKAYDEALVIDASCVPALIGRGTAYQLMGQHDLAIRDLDRVVDAYPEQAQSYMARALIYRLAGKDERATEDLTTALRLQPTHAKALLLRSQTYRSMGRQAQAAADLHEVMELDPNSVEGHIELADVHREKGELDKALASLDHAVKLDPHSARGFRSRAGILFNRGEYQRAAGDFKEAVRLQPDYPYFRVQLFVAQTRADEDALHDLRVYRETLDDSDDVFTTALVRTCLGELTPQEFLAAASSDDPKTHKDRMCEAHYYIGQLQLISGKSARARASFEKCVATGVEDSVEYTGAEAELERMHRPARAAGDGRE